MQVGSQQLTLLKIISVFLLLIETYRGILARNLLTQLFVSP